MRLAVDVPASLALGTVYGLTLAPRQHAVRLGAPLHLGDAALLRQQASVLAAGQLTGAPCALDAVVLARLAGIDIAPRVPILRDAGNSRSQEQPDPTNRTEMIFMDVS